MVYTNDDEGQCRRCHGHGPYEKAGRYADGRQRYRDVCKVCARARVLAWWRERHPDARRFV